MSESKKFEALLSALELKQKDIALKLGLSPSGVSAIMQGKQGITDTIKILLNVLFNVNPDWWENDSSPMFAENKVPSPELTQEEMDLINNLRNLPKKERNKIMKVFKALME